MPREEKADKGNKDERFDVSIVCTITKRHGEDYVYTKPYNEFGDKYKDMTYEGMTLIQSTLVEAATKLVSKGLAKVE